MPDSKSNSSKSSPDENLRKRIKISTSSDDPSEKAAKHQTAPEVPKGLLKSEDLSEGPETDSNEASLKVKQASKDKTQEPEENSPDPLPESTVLDDKETDAAVNDIAANEGDAVLALEDAINTRKTLFPAQASDIKAKLKALLRNKWTWVSVAALLLIVLAVPFTRYMLLGLVIKEPVVVTVLDSNTNTPVSSAEVQLGGSTAKTNASGQASLKPSVGSHNLIVTKQYYKNLSQTYFVSFKSKSQPDVKLIATGRIVPVTVLNAISGKPVQGVEIDVKGTVAKTDGQGKASIALPTTSNSYKATLSLSGYNTSSDNVTVTNQVTKANSFNLSPSGSIYFLSNRSGSIDVDKVNLDGSNPSTVLAGTGQESSTTTFLLAARDWHYLALEANRSGTGPALYLIDTSNNKVTEFDSGGGSITIVGWYGHDFIYDITNSSDTAWQSGRETLKSYDADTLQLNQLDQNQASGSAGSYAYQSFNNFYTVNGYVVYSTQWVDAGAGLSSSQSDTIRAVQTNGQSQKDYESFAANSTSSIQAQQYSPQAIYFAVNDDSNNTTYYSYSNQAVQSSSITSGTFKATYPTYLVSPSGNLTFWAQLLNGKDTLFTGNNDGSSSKQIASLSGYTPYAWYSDNYVLLTKDSSRLYIMSASGLSSGQQPLEVTNYFKPSLSVQNNDYSYGGF